MSDLPTADLPDMVVTATPPIRSQARRPRARVTVAGVVMPATRIEVVSNAYFAADTFRAEFAFGALPAQYGPAWWGEQGRIEVEIAVSLAPDEPAETLILGRVDDVEMDLPGGRVSVTGRDYTGDLQENRTTEKYQNLTASEVARKIAAAHGLTPVVTDTTALVGTYYGDDHVLIGDDTTEWNLLTYLAEQAGLQVWVRGRELHFEAGAQQTAPPLIYDATGTIPSANVASIRLRRSLVLARDVAVKVISWNAGKGRRIEVTRRARKAGRTQEFGGIAQSYVYRVPGLTEEQAIQRAETELERISRHERLVDVEMPGELTIYPPMLLDLRGTGTSWDQQYHVDEVARRLSPDEGFVQVVTLKNHTVQSMVSL